MLDHVPDVELDELDIESVQYPCMATIVVPNERGQQPMKVRAVLDSEAGVSCVSEKAARKLGDKVEGAQIVNPIRRSAKARVTERGELPIEQQTRAVGVTILAPRTPVEVKLAVAVAPDVDDVLTIGSESMRHQLGMPMCYRHSGTNCREMVER